MPEMTPSISTIREQIQGLNKLRKLTQKTLDGCQVDTLIEIGHYLCDALETARAENAEPRAALHELRHPLGRPKV